MVDELDQSWADEVIGSVMTPRDDAVVDPDEDAAAIDLLEAILSIETSTASPEGRWERLTRARFGAYPERGMRSGRRSYRRGVAVLAVAAAVLLVLVIVGVFNTGSPALRSASRWRLAGYVSGWTAGSSSPGEGGLTCPTTATCYLTGPTSIGPLTSQPVPVDSVFVSKDAGVDWSGPLELPAGTTFTTTLQCPSENDCLAGGTSVEPGESGDLYLLLSTTDGGQSWQETPLPAGVGGLRALSCLSVDTCFGLTGSFSTASALGMGQFYGTTPQPGTFLATTDGGSTWSQSTLPTQDTIALLDCTAGTSCVAAGVQYGGSSGTQTSAIALVTNDDGATWSSVALTGAATTTALSCPTMNDCFALGSWSEVVPTPSYATYCKKGLPCLGPGGSTFTAGVSQVYATTNGGTSWTADPFPDSFPEVDAHLLTCPSVDQCWVSGSDEVPTTTTDPNASFGSPDSPVVLTTDDGGATWVDSTPPATAAPPAPASPEPLAALECPATDVCFALTYSLGGTEATVYSYGGDASG